MENYKSNMDFEQMKEILGGIVSVTKNNSESTAIILKDLETTKALVGGLSKNVKNLQEDVEIVKTDLDNVKRNEKIDRSQKNSIRRAVRSRVSFLLDIKYDTNGNVVRECMKDYNLYFKPFCRKCYVDCNKLNHLASPYDETRKIDFDDAMNDIECWRPKGGANSYKKYLDDLRSV